MKQANIPAPSIEHLCDPDAEGALRRENGKRARTIGLPFESVGMGPHAEHVQGMNYVDAVWEGVERASGTRVSCPPFPAKNWAEVRELAGDGLRPRWVEHGPRSMICGLQQVIPRGLD